MKKEKTIKTYQRRTKSGKVVTVKQHTAKYDAADKAKEMASKKGAGEELAAKKGMPDHNLPMNEYLAELKKMRGNPEETPMEQETKKSSPSAEKKSKSVKSTKSTKNAATTQANGVSASDFKSWYHFNDWDKPKKSWPAEVRAADAAIRKQLGSKKAYDDYCAQIDGSYSKRGHNTAFTSFGNLAKGNTTSGAKTRTDLPKMVYGGDTKKDSSASKRAGDTLKREGYTLGKDNLYHNKEGKVVRINQKTGNFEELSPAKSKATSATNVKALNKELIGLINKNGGTVNRGNKESKRIKEILKQLDDIKVSEKRKKTLSSLKSKGYIKYGSKDPFYFKPSTEGSFRGSYVEIRSDGTARPLISSSKEGAKAIVAKRMGKTYKPRKLR